MRVRQRHEVLGLAKLEYRDAQKRIGWARESFGTGGGSEEVTAARLGLSYEELVRVCRLLIGSKRLTADEMLLVRRVAAVPMGRIRPATRARQRAAPEILAERDNDLVYVTTSGPSGAFHARKDCPLLHRGQASAITAGKGLSSVALVWQGDAETAGRRPCAGCVPRLGSAVLLPQDDMAKLLRHPGRPAVSPPSTPPVEPPTATVSKRGAKRLRDQAEAAQRGISVSQLRTRRRLEQERAAVRGRARS